MAYFPMFVELENAQALLVGGGHVALEKAQRLLPYGVHLRVIAPEVLPALQALPHVTAEQKSFAPDDLDPTLVFVIAATDDRVLNHEIAELCHRWRIPVNAVDAPSDCSFLFPALIREGPLSIGVSTGGASPVAAAALRTRIRSALPPAIGEILGWMKELRPEVRRRSPTQVQRKAIYEALFSESMRLQRPLTGAETERVIADAWAESEK